ncbi:MAG: hypothetical protein ACFCVG_00435 [Kineosporiaceae bacterium]
MSDQPRAEDGPDQPADPGPKPDEAPTTAFSWEATDPPAGATREDPAAGPPRPAGADGGELPPPPPPGLGADPTQVMSAPSPGPPVPADTTPPATALPAPPSYATPSYAEPSYARPEYSPQASGAPARPGPAQPAPPQPYSQPGYPQPSYSHPTPPPPAYPAPGYGPPAGYGAPAGYAAPPPLTPESEDVRGKAILWTILNGVAIFLCGNIGAIVGVILAAVAIGRARTDVPGARRFVKWSWISFVIGFAVGIVFWTIYFVAIVALGIASA